MRRRDARFVVAALVILAGVPACANRAPSSVRSGDASFTRTVELPPPVLDGRLSLEQALLQRRSSYEFRPDPIPLGEIGQLFWAAQGVTRPDGKRTAPSAGALYPLELYALTDDTELHYLPDGHRAELHPARPWRDAMQRAAFGQEVVGRPPAVIVVAAVPARTRVKYGPLADDFVQREAGHATENLLLEAAARNLAAVSVGGVDSAAAATILALTPGTIVIYVIPIGYPMTATG